MCVYDWGQAKIRKDLLAHAFTEASVRESLFRNVDVLLFLYQDFCNRHDVSALTAPKEDVEVQSFLKRHVPSEQDLQVFLTIHNFNKSVLK